jgi:hypothetical protein
LVTALRAASFRVFALVFSTRSPLRTSKIVGKSIENLPALAYPLEIKTASQTGRLRSWRNAKYFETLLGHSTDGIAPAHRVDTSFIFGLFFAP